MRYNIFPVLILSALYSQQERFDIPDQLRGGDFVPNLERVERGLADWRELGIRKDEIDSVRIYGFGKFNSNVGLDFEIKDERVFEFISLSLKKSLCLRPAISDFDNSRVAFGFGDFVGIVQVKKADGGSLIIGVASSGFYLGTFHGCEHQKFYSCCLGKLIEQVCRNRCSDELPVEFIADISGEGVAKKNQKLLSDFPDLFGGQ